MTRLRSALTFANVSSFLALAIALTTGGAYAANTISSSDIVNGQVKTPDLATDAVTSPKIKNGGTTTLDLGANSVTSAKILNETITSADVDNAGLTMSDIKGADNSGSIFLNAGVVPNLGCKDFVLTVNGAEVGDAVLLSLRAAAPEGMLIYGVGVPAAGQVTMKACNFTGGPSPALSSVPIRLFTLD
jgi:hypothetical protein